MKRLEKGTDDPPTKRILSQQNDLLEKLIRDTNRNEASKALLSTLASETDLTGVSLKGKSEGVKSEVQKLIERVKRKVSEPGGKSKLARALGVAPARISEWLSGEKEPGGEYALRLLKWVES